MNFSVEGMLDEAKEKAVEEATAKFGPSATPTAEEIAGKAEEMVAARMGVSLHVVTPPDDPAVPADSHAGTESAPGAEK